MTRHGVDMAVVVDPNDLHVELVDRGATADLEPMAADTEDWP